MKKDKLIGELDKQIKNKRSEYFYMPEGHERAAIVNRVNGLYQAKKLVDQLDEPELPVIPQFVAELLEGARKEVIDLTFWGFIKIISDEGFKDNESCEGKFVAWVTKDNNEEILMRAWLSKDGYKIEEEKLYYVKLKSEVANQLFLGNYKYLNVLIGEKGQPYTFDKKAGYSNFFKTMLNKEEVEIWKNKLNALDFDIEEVTQ